MKSPPVDAVNRPSLDVWFCLIVSLLMAAHAALRVLDWQFPGWADYPVRLLMLVGLLIVPGYATAVLARLDRYGIAGFAGLSLALSLAILALAGSLFWLATETFSVVALEAMIAALSCCLTVVALVRARGNQAGAELGNARGVAIVLLMLPALISLVAFSNTLPASPATRFTEFSVVAVQPRSVVVRIANHEGSDRTYTIVARRDATEAVNESITVPVEQSIEETVAIPDGDADELRLLLLRPGEHEPYRSLSLRLDRSS